MRKRNLLMTFIVMALTLSFVSQVLAQAPIEGWDKARFGMSPEELKGVYAEEEEYFKPDAFWQEQKEDKFSHVPYTLFTSELTLLGRAGIVILFFVNDRLFEITVMTGEYLSSLLWMIRNSQFEPSALFHLWEEGKSKGIMTLEERKRKMMEAREQLKLTKKERKYAYSFDLNLPSELLTNKYGEPSIIERQEGAIHRWDDEKGNILLLRDYVPLSADVPESSSLSYFFIVTYTNRELINLWTAKVDEWEKERKRIIQKGIEVF